VLPWLEWSFLGAGLSDLAPSPSPADSDRVVLVSTDEEDSPRSGDVLTSQSFGNDASVPPFSAVQATGPGGDTVGNPALSPADDLLLSLASLSHAHGTALSGPATVAGPGGGTATPTAPLTQERSESAPPVTQAATGALQQTHLALNLQPLTVTAINLAEASSFQVRPIQFSIVHHQTFQGDGTAASLAAGNGTTPLSDRDDNDSIGGVNYTATYIGGTVDTDTGSAIAVDATGNSYVAGWTEGPSSLGFVAKYDALGKQVYLTAFQATDPSPLFTYTNTRAHAIAVDATGNAYVTGSARNTLLGETDGYALKLSADGRTVLYSTAFGNPPFDASGNGIVVNSTGQATITGSLKSSPVQTNIFAIQINATGSAALWQAYYQFPGYTDSAGTSVALTNDGTVAFMAGWVIPSSGDRDFFALKVNNANGQAFGTVGAFTTPPNLGEDILNAIGIDNEGNPYVAGTLVVNGTTPQAYFAKIKADFSDSVYATVFDTPQAGWSLAVDKETGELYGTCSERDGTLDHTFVVKLNNAGVSLGDREMRGDGNDIGYGIAYFKGTNTAYMTGTTSSTTVSSDGTKLTGLRDAFLTSFSNFGT
jgi:hypothetical protein